MAVIEGFVSGLVVLGGGDLDQRFKFQAEEPSYRRLHRPVWRAPAMSTHRVVTHRRAEIATAITDMACKQSTNFMGVTVAVQSGYDKQYITATTAALAGFRKRLDKQITMAERIIADSKPG